eukprot:221891_1
MPNPHIGRKRSRYELEFEMSRASLYPVYKLRTLTMVYCSKFSAESIFDEEWNIFCNNLKDVPRLPTIGVEVAISGKFMEFQTLRPLQLLHFESSECVSRETLHNLQSRVDKASCDGWIKHFNATDSMICLKRSDCVRLIDDDKQSGRHQAFVTDMFSRQRICNYNGDNHYR